MLDPGFARANVVAEFSYPANAESVRALTDGWVSTVNSDDVIAEVTAQACHQAGLSVVFRELLDFGGDECYFSEVPELVGHTYAEALLAFETSSVIGCYSFDGTVRLNPPGGSVFEVGDEVIAISADDDTVAFAGFRDVPVVEPAEPGATLSAAVRVLIVGWSTFGPKVVQELNEFLGPGSQIDVWLDATLIEPSAVDEIPRVAPGARVRLVGGGPEKLLALSDEAPFDQVIVLGYRRAFPSPRPTHGRS